MYQKWKKKYIRGEIRSRCESVRITMDAIEKFDEKNIFNINIALDEGTGQTNHFYPVKEIIEYFKEELLKKNSKIEKLSSELEEFRKSKSKFAKPTGTKLKSMQGNQAAQ